jgi:hypothetical protein
MKYTAQIPPASLLKEAGGISYINKLGGSEAKQALFLTPIILNKIINRGALKLDS